MHGKSLSCFLRHAHDDEVVGTPLCESCYDDRAQVLHNVATPELWRRTSAAMDVSQFTWGDTVGLSTVGRPGLEPGTLGLKVPCSSR